MTRFIFTASEADMEAADLTQIKRRVIGAARQYPDMDRWGLLCDGEHWSVTKTKTGFSITKPESEDQ